MKNFRYFRPETVEQAVGLLDALWGKTELLAGGTDLLDLQKEYIAQPEKVVSLTGLRTEGFHDIKLNGDNASLTIGAGVKLAEIAEHKDLRRLFPALTESARIIGGPQIRNMGTLGGNLCQRNRCWYFRDEKVPCLLKGGKKCYALEGENRYHAVFTQGHPCVIVNPSTLAPALIALNAIAKVVGPKGSRTVSLEKFFQAPKSSLDREHVLAANEVLVAVTLHFPLVFDQSPELRNASYEVRQKLSSDWPLVQAAVSLWIKDGKAKDARVVLGHVAPTPLLVEDVGKALEGQAINETTAAEAGQIAAKGAKPLSQNAYKVKLIEVAVKRAILTAAGAKKYWEL
jgi:xanthine dehydrogenase YagS FAD-binding subunit